MANHCLNKIRVLGVKGNELAKIMKNFDGKDSSFQYKIGKVGGYYSWAFNLAKSKDNEVFFFTRWSPPTYFIEQLSAKYPKATFNMMYVEGGMELYGYEKYKNGEMYWENDLLFNTGRHTADFSRRLWRNYEIALNYDSSTGGLR